jgi:CTP:molybdopterin cytidylyltransferase MocA
VTVAGLLLAAGAGRRMGLPKGLLRDADDVPYLRRGVSVLRDGGVDAVTVVVGASADVLAGLLDEDVLRGGPPLDVVTAADWAEGMGASLRGGLRHLLDSDHDVALVNLVDLPDVTSAVVRRVLAAGSPAGAAALARASFEGRPGHPVLLGRAHWSGVIASAQGDRGARAYLTAHSHLDVPCGDLATGRDVDSPDDLPPGS